MAADANLRGGYPSARVLLVVGRHRNSLYMCVVVAACAVADGPGAPIVEYCVHFVLDIVIGGHTLSNSPLFFNTSCTSC